MIILGIDPGFDRLGCAIVEKGCPPTGTGEKLIFSDCLTADKKLSQEKRLAKLSKELEKVIAKYKPDFLAIEKIFFTKNQKTMVGVAQACGMVLTIAGLNNIPAEELSPPEIKLAVTGYGSAEKKQVQKMVQIILKMEKVPKYDDEIDAIAVALAYSAKLSTKRLRALDK